MAQNPRQMNTQNEVNVELHQSIVTLERIQQMLNELDVKVNREDMIDLTYRERYFELHGMFREQVLPMLSSVKSQIELVKNGYGKIVNSIMKMEMVIEEAEHHVPNGTDNSWQDEERANSFVVDKEKLLYHGDRRFKVGKDIADEKHSKSAAPQGDTPV